MLAESVPLCQIRPVHSVVEFGGNYRLCDGYLQAVTVMSLDEITYKGMMKEKHQETVVYDEIFDKVNTQYVVVALEALGTKWPVHTQVFKRDSTKNEMIC